MEVPDYKKFLTHVLLVALAVSGLWGFASNLDWVLAPSRRGDMTPVKALVVKKWEKRKGGAKGTGYTLHVLELVSREGCSCRGSAQVGPYLYDRTEVGGRVEALCLSGACYSPDDRRWDTGYRLQLWLYLVTALVFGGIEAVQLFKYFLRRE